MKKYTPGALAALLAFGAAPVFAEEKKLQEIVVKGQSFAPETSAFTANVIEQETIRERQVSRMQDLFREVPGMAVRNYNLGGVADSVSLRGFGGGMHGGDIGMAIDGVPLNETMSHADGYADQNVIVPLELERLTVFKGPVSALYGNYSRGGTLALESRKSGDYREIDVKAGSFSTVDLQGALGFHSGAMQGNFAAQAYNTAGFREQSDYHRATLTGRLAFELGNGAQLAISARVHEARWDSASYITRAQYEDAARRFKKPVEVMNDGGQKSFTTERVDFSKTLSDDLRFLAFAHATQQTFARYYSRPNPGVWEQRMEDYDRSVRGMGASLNGLSRPAGKPLDWVLGVENYHENTLYRYKDALDNRAETATTLTRAYLNRDYVSRSTSAFAQGEWKLAQLFKPMLGVRYDHFGGDCSLKGSEYNAGTGNPCQSMTNYAHTSPKIGVRSSWSPLLDSRLSFAEGFQLPSASARFGTGGSSVQPTVLQQKELGFTLKPARGALVDLALFRIDTENELRDLGGGNFQNFGKNRRDGVEIDVQVSLSDRFDVSAALTLLDTKVLENASASLVGKKIPGIAERNATLRGRYRFDGGWAGDLAIQRVGGFPLDAANTVNLAGYTTVDLTVNWEQKESGRRQRYYLSVNNLTDRVYAASGSYSASSGIQLFAPAPPRTLMLGISADL